MSNGSRHLFGFLLGIAAVPVAGFGLAWAPHWPSVYGVGIDDVPRVPEAVPPLVALGVLAVVIGFLTGSRLSPLAAAVPGLALAALGVLDATPWPVPVVPGYLEPPGGGAPWFPWGPLFILVGGLLFASALPPSRWRARHRPGLAGDDDGDDDSPYPAARRFDGDPPAAARQGPEQRASHTPAEGTPIRDWNTAAGRPAGEPPWTEPRHRRLRGGDGGPGRPSP
ncbi:hypothetical protein ACFOVU_14065 [Nocardiopsis sediminis]|uniref:Trp biosynthesis protein n=1 Tax=Nocardiopsis sediminis TaxID=1778267 RepID=A0ABV8FQR8_9ACTN